MDNEAHVSRATGTQKSLGVELEETGRTRQETDRPGTLKNGFDLHRDGEWT